MTEREKAALAALVLRSVDATWEARKANQRAEIAERRAEEAEKELAFLRVEYDDLKAMLDNPDELAEWLRDYAADCLPIDMTDLYRHANGYH